MKKKSIKYKLENRQLESLLVNGFYSDQGQFRDSSLKFIKTSYESLGFVRVVDKKDFKRGDFWVMERVVEKWLSNGFYFKGEGFHGFIVDDELKDHPFQIGDVVKIGFKFKTPKIYDMRIVYLGDEDEED